MAVGARITSNNLSGKTATVTFTPYTGLTSGTTENLGTKTIPFNNINTHPYGDYNLYFAEYDYTYTLNVPEPDASVQSFAYLNRIVDSDNYGVAFLNFNDFTAEIIDLGVDTNVWNNNNMYVLDNSGYMHYFTGENDSDDRLVIFTDAQHEEIGRYSGTTESVSRNDLDGKWLTFEDVDNGVFTYSNGVEVFTYTWDPALYYVDIEWNYDAATSDGTMILEKWEVEPLSGWTYNGPGTSHIVNPTDGTTTLFKTWTDGTYIRHKITPSSDFIVVLTETQGVTNAYTNFQIYDTSGTLLETVPLNQDLLGPVTAVTYNNYYEEFHGTNKFTIVFYDSYSENTRYKIISYNGETENLIVTYHVRGPEYTSINTTADSNFWPYDDGNNGGIVITLYNSVTSNNIGTEVTYCDIMYMFDNQTSFSTYTFADDESKTINSYGQLSDIYRVSCVNGDDVASMLTIMSGSTRIESMNVSVSGISYMDWYQLGNRTVVQIMTNDYNNVTYKYINQSGVVIGELNDYLLVSQWATNVNSFGETAYLTIQHEGNDGYYVYSGSTGFTQTDYYNNSSDTDFYSSPTSNYDGAMVLYTNDEVGFRILTPTGITNEFNFPEYNQFDIRVGKSKFMFVYNETSGGVTKIRLYNFSGTLLNSETTTWTNGWDNTYGVKDRFVVMNYDGDNTVEIYLVSENTITSVTTQDYNSEEATNDWFYDND
jgi:hypothetical protein